MIGDTKTLKHYRTNEFHKEPWLYLLGKASLFVLIIGLSVIDSITTYLGIAKYNLFEINPIWDFISIKINPIAILFMKPFFDIAIVAFCVKLIRGFSSGENWRIAEFLIIVFKLCVICFFFKAIINNVTLIRSLS
jgi:hypothetical protein